MMADVEEVEVVVAHHERATLRVGGVFLKIDADQARTDVEVEAMAMAPVPTPEILWRKPPVLALAALPGGTCCVPNQCRTCEIPSGHALPNADVGRRRRDQRR